LASKIMGIKSKTFDVPSGSSLVGSSAATTGGSDRRLNVKLTPKEKKRVEELIRNAKSLQEIAKLEKELAEGRIPGGIRDDDAEMEG
jgi:U2 small nuclear ribonucleoprotein A'